MTHETHFQSFFFFLQTVMVDRSQLFTPEFIKYVYKTNTDNSLVFLTFNTDEHELVERQGAVVGHNIGGLDAAQVDLAEVLFAGETRQGHISQVRISRVFRHFEGERTSQVTFYIHEHPVNTVITHKTTNRFMT